MLNNFSRCLCIILNTEYCSVQKKNVKKRRTLLYNSSLTGNIARCFSSFYTTLRLSITLQYITESPQLLHSSNCSHVLLVGHVLLVLLNFVALGRLPTCHGNRSSSKSEWRSKHLKIQKQISIGQHSGTVLTSSMAVLSNLKSPNPSHKSRVHRVCFTTKTSFVNINWLLNLRLF